MSPKAVLRRGRRAWSSRWGTVQLRCFACDLDYITTCRFRPVITSAARLIYFHIAHLFMFQASGPPLLCLVITILFATFDNRFCTISGVAITISLKLDEDV
jgi:hypothetical protein